MSVVILSGTRNKRQDFAVFACNTSDWAFGPLMESREEAEAFLDWLLKDPRTYDDDALGLAYCTFLKEIGRDDE